LADSVICGRCHRSIPQRELNNHMASHKSKKPKPFPRGIPPAQTGTQPPLPSSFEQFVADHWKSLPAKSDLSTEQVRETFSAVLREMDLPVASLKVRVERARIQAEVLFDANRNVTLNYDDNYLRTLSEDEIRAMLTHEGCHVATLPDTQIIAPSADSPHALFIDIFDEYLGYAGFARKFGGTRTFDIFKDMKARDFQNYDVIVTMAQAGAMDILKALFAILNDAIYFPTVGDNRFADWCKSKRLTYLPQFLDWIIEDFKFVESLKLTRTQTMELLHVEGGLASAVNFYLLLGDHSRGPDLFAPAAETIFNIFAEKSKSPLMQVWRTRRAGVIP